jgi:biopolymer transport protein ExbD
MNFDRQRADEPDINLVPFIDVLLVILIFLMLATSFSKFTELQVNLPTAEAEKTRDRPNEVIVSISADGRYAVNSRPVDGRSVDELARALKEASNGNAEAMIIVSADATAPHQTVVNVMDAARRAQLARLTFATQTPNSAAIR